MNEKVRHIWLKYKSGMVVIYKGNISGDQNRILSNSVRASFNISPQRLLPLTLYLPEARVKAKPKRHLCSVSRSKAVHRTSNMKH